MRDATGNMSVPGRGAVTELNKTRDGFTGWVVLSAATMATAMALIGSANLVGDRFDTRPMTWTVPASN
jgi:hypothetical protein